MRKSIIVLLLAVLIVFAACNNSGPEPQEGPQYGSITVNANMGNTKSIEPLASLLEISRYTIQGEHQNGTTFPEEEMTTNPYTKENIIVGTWTITVNGYNSESILVATKTQNVSVSKGATTDSVFNLEYPTDGKGSYSIVLSVSDENTSLSSISYSLTPIPSGTPVNGEITAYTNDSINHKHNYIISASNVSTGKYTLVATLKNSNGATLFTYGPEVVCIYKGFQSSDEITIDEKYMPMVSTPVISPNGGSFTSSADIVITCATAGASIYYTLDGTNPTNESTLYSGQFTINENLATGELKAIAYKQGLTSSEVASNTNPFCVSVVSPIVSPNGGSYNNSQSISISTDTQGASIYYTTDGSEPSTESNLYTGPFSLAKNGSVVKAIAVKNNMDNSIVCSSSSFEFRVANPEISPGTLTAETSVQVSLSCSTIGATIRYTTDGTTPSKTSGTIYAGPFDIAETGKTIKAIAYLTDMIDSGVVTTGPYEISVASPVFNVVDIAAGRKKINISSIVDGSVVQYSIDNGANWLTYTDGSTSLEYSEQKTVKFRISKENLTTIERTITVSWDEGNGGISYNAPFHYSLSINTPDGWNGEVFTTTTSTLTATWNTSPNSASYQWYLDGAAINGKTSDTLSLADVTLSVGSHNIAVIGTAGDSVCSASVPVYVSTSHEFKDMSWEEISAISQAGTYLDYGWQVGDYKEVTINGTLGTQQYTDYTIRAVILDFVDNSIVMGLVQNTDGENIALGYYYASYSATSNFTCNYNNTFNGVASVMGVWESPSFGWGNKVSVISNAVTQINSALPTDLTDNVRTVKKYSLSGINGINVRYSGGSFVSSSHGTAQITQCDETFWPLSAAEIKGTGQTKDYEDQLQYFTDSEKTTGYKVWRGSEYANLNVFVRDIETNVTHDQNYVKVKGFAKYLTTTGTITYNSESNTTVNGGILWAFII